MKSPRHVVLLCEDGWQGIRQFALLLSENHISVSVIIKGDPGREVKQMISPKPLIQNYFFDRKFYRISLFLLLIWFYLKNRCEVCCVTKKRTLKQIGIFRGLLRVKLYEFLELGPNSLLVDSSGNQIPFRQYLEHLR